MHFEQFQAHFEHFKVGTSKQPIQILNKICLLKFFGNDGESGTYRAAVTGSRIFFYIIDLKSLKLSVVSNLMFKYQINISFLCHTKVKVKEKGEKWTICFDYAFRYFPKEGIDWLLWQLSTLARPVEVRRPKSFWNQIWILIYLCFHIFFHI